MNAEVAQIQKQDNTFLALVEGKVSAITEPKNSDWVYIILQCKPKDEYSLPPTLQLSLPAGERIPCKVGDILKTKVKLAGYPRKSGDNTFYHNTLEISA